MEEFLSHNPEGDLEASTGVPQDNSIYLPPLVLEGLTLSECQVLFFVFSQLESLQNRAPEVHTCTEV